MSDSERAAEQYDAMAADYASDNDDGVFNALYERPAMVDLLGEVDGLRVLDVGCGAGQLSEVHPHFLFVKAVADGGGR